MLFLFSFFLLVSSNDEVKPTQEAILGTWSISKVDVTHDSLENPDVENFTLFVQNIQDEFHFEGNTSNGETVSIYFDHRNGTFTLEFSKSKLSISNIVKITKNGLRGCHGALLVPDVSYSFVILSSYRFELTVFNRETNKVTLYRMYKDFESNKLSAFAKFSSYLLRKSIFRAL